MRGTPRGVPVTYVERYFSYHSRRVYWLENGSVETGWRDNSIRCYVRRSMTTAGKEISMLRCPFAELGRRFSAQRSAFP
jgi:hypothetical protein